MMESDRMMIDAQARLISSLNVEVKSLRRNLDLAQQELANYKKAGQFYLEMQKNIQENTILQGEWRRFCTFLKMTIPDDLKDEK